jgi:hypothetical protein
VKSRGLGSTEKDPEMVIKRIMIQRIGTQGLGKTEEYIMIQRFRMYMIGIQIDKFPEDRNPEERIQRIRIQKIRVQKIRI